MSVRWIIFTGSSEETQQQAVLVDALTSSIEGLCIKCLKDGLDMLSRLAQNPDRYMIAIIDIRLSDLPPAKILDGIKTINPEAEIVLLCPDGYDHPDTLSSGRRPLLLRKPVHPENLVSCVAKLIELVETRRTYERTSLGLKKQISLSRKNIEAVLAMFNRPVGVGMITTRRDGFITFYNPEARRLTGYSQDESPHIRKWLENIVRDPGELQHVLTSYNRAWNLGRKIEELNFKIWQKGGRPLTLSSTTMLLQDDRGEPRQLVILIYDTKDQAATRAYRSLMASETSALYSYYPRYGFSRISPAALDLINQAYDLDLTEADMWGARLQELPLPEDQIQAWETMIEETMAGHINHRFETLKPLGIPSRRIMQHASLTPIPYGDDGLVGVVAVLQERPDLIASRYNDLSLDALCRMTLMRLPQPFALLKSVRNPNGRISDLTCLMLNTAAKTLFRVEDRDDLRLNDLFQEDELVGVVFGHAVETTEHGQAFRFEHEMLGAGGPDGPCLMEFKIYKVGDGVGIFIEDVTAQRKEEWALKKYRNIFAYMEESIVVTDLEGNITDWNPASERMFGYAKEEILGKPASILVGESVGMYYEPGTRSVRHEGEVWTGEYMFRRRNGHPGVASTVFTMLIDDQGRAYGTVGLNRDVTESKRLEERLLSRSKELEEKNIALNTLLRHAEDERIRACEVVVKAVTARFTDGLTRILASKEEPEKVTHISRVLLQDLGSSDPDHFQRSNKTLADLSEKELDVARLIRLGKTTEQIAFILDKSPDTVRLQRISIRKKLGLERRDKNLQKYLNSLDVF
jgi:PAS domain S-box-containing protein